MSVRIAEGRQGDYSRIEIHRNIFIARIPFVEVICRGETGNNGGLSFYCRGREGRGGREGKKGREKITSRTGVGISERRGEETELRERIGRIGQDEKGGPGVSLRERVRTRRGGRKRKRERGKEGGVNGEEGSLVGWE